MTRVPTLARTAEIAASRDCGLSSCGIIDNRHDKIGAVNHKIESVMKWAQPKRERQRTDCDGFPAVLSRSDVFQASNRYMENERLRDRVPSATIANPGAGFTRQGSLRR